MFKFINVPAFLLSFLVGLCIVYFQMKTDVREVFVYPTPENVHLLQYKDKSGMCFEYKQTEVSCDTAKKPNPVVSSSMLPSLPSLPSFPTEWNLDMFHSKETTPTAITATATVQLMDQPTTTQPPILSDYLPQ